MEERGLLQGMESGYLHIAEMFSKVFISVVELDLETGIAVTLKSPDTEVVMKQIQWETLLGRYAERRSCPEDCSIILSEFSIGQLRGLTQNGQKNKAIEVRCGGKKGGYEWMELSATLVSADEKRMLVTTRNINEQRLLKSIVDRYVFKNCDYFVLLDAKNNSFIRFMGSKNGTDLPPMICEDYTALLREYNERNVMPYDADRLTQAMQIDHIIEVLENQDEYNLYCDSHPEQGIIRRKHIQMSYHDKAKGLVLFSRTDITEVYLQERAINEQLRTALKKAKTDSLTELYNQVTTADLISQKLSNPNCKMATLLFVDIDNFKMVNDTLGHLKGDFLLKFAAAFLRKLVGEQGFVGRIGGDEFLIFLSGTRSVKDIEYYGEQICHTFIGIEDESIKELDISCSVGVSIFPSDGVDYETLARKADQALYDAKRHGKNKYNFYSDTVDRESYETMVSQIDDK